MDDQDVDDQGSPQSGVISVQVRVPAHTERRYGDLIERLMEMAAAEERGYREYREPSEHTRLEWRVESTSSDRRCRRPEITPSNRPSFDRP